jgi:hypothetical protein
MSNALVMQVKLVGTPEEAHTMLYEVVVPAAKAQPGFESGTWMHDGAGNGMGILVFAASEDAEAAKGALRPPPGGPELVAANVWLVTAQA